MFDNLFFCFCAARLSTLSIGRLFLFAACLSPVRTLPTPTLWPTPTAAARTTYRVQRATLMDEIQ